MMMMKRPHLKLIVTFALLLCILMAEINNAQPIREKRSGISDQRLAELETLIALSTMRGRLRNSQVAYGVIDPAKIGKRKRSFLLGSLGRKAKKEEEEEEEKGAELLLQRIFRSADSEENDYQDSNGNSFA